jgi:hypothetical protein
MAFFAHFLPFCGKSLEVPFLEAFTGQTGLFAVKPSQTQSNPVKPFFCLDRDQAQLSS